MSKLTYNSVFPSPIEKQNVTFCLPVFWKETIVALGCYSCSQGLAAGGTILFPKLNVNFWKIVNVHFKDMDLRFNDNRRAVVSSPDDERLSFLIKLACMAKQMIAESRKRIRKLTKETGTMLAHTCRAFVHLAQHMLGTGKKYVLFG